MTVTGWHLDGTPTTIEYRQSELEWLYGEVFKDPNTKPVPAAIPQASRPPMPNILSVAKSAKNGEKFSKLWKGDWEDDYPSQSEADLALASMLGFYTGPNEKLLDDLFRKSGLYRDKWERDDYRQRVLVKAMNRDESYSGGVSSAVEQLAQDVAARGHLRPNKKKKRKPNQTERLIEIVQAGELWRTPDRQCYATIPVGDHFENWRIRNSGFRIWLLGRYHDIHKKTPTDTAMKAALDVLEYMAMQGAVHEVHLRVARLEDRIYWDLGNEKWEAIEITAEGWRVIERPPVKFRRTHNTAELPRPVAGGSLEELKHLLKFPDEYWGLVRGWLLDCLKGHKPYLVLVVSGEHGTAKSTLLRCLRQVIDPLQKAELSSLPREERDLGVDGESEYCLAYDNVSYLPPWLSDALCRVSTGAGIKTRRLYTDNEQAVFGFARPIALNGIPDFAENQDLLSRSIIIGQPPIADTDRKGETDMGAAYAAMQPRLVGALCDLVSQGLREFRTTRFDRLPRMADSTIWITACTGDRQFLDHLLENQTAAQEIALESSLVAEALLKWLPKTRQWQGNCKELLESLRAVFRDRGEWDKLGKLPKSPRALSGSLKKDAPAMRTMHKLDVQVGILGSRGKRLVVIKPMPELLTPNGG